MKLTVDRLNIASSSFPRFLPNPGTGEPIHLAREGVVATNTIYHDAERPSSLTLPILPTAMASYRPQVRLSVPDFVTDGRPVLIEAEADSFGSTKVERVEFWLGGKLVKTDTDRPYDLSLQALREGRYEVWATVVDNWNRRRSVKRSVFYGRRALERQVFDSNDDAEELPGGRMYLDSSDLELVRDARRGRQVVGLRFRNIKIPAGAKIKRAYLQFETDKKSVIDTRLEIAAERTPNAPRFSGEAKNISNRRMTNTSVMWIPASWKTIGERAETQRTPDLAPLVEEVVAQKGWKVGNSIVFIIRGTGYRVARAFDGGPNSAATLYIEF